MNLLKIALIASCAVLISGCAPKVLYVFEVPEVRVELMDKECKIKEVVEMKVDGVKGGTAKFANEDKKVELCWKEVMPGVAAIVDEAGRSGLIPMNEPKK